MQYVATPGPGVKPVTLPALRVVDAHSLPNRKASKAVRACDGADILDGLASLQNFTAKLVAMAEGVSVSSLVAARRLTPEQRDEVRGGTRPLVLPVKPVPLPLPPPVVAGSVPSAEQRLRDIANEMGPAKALEALVKIELAAIA